MLSRPYSLYKNQPKKLTISSRGSPSGLSLVHINFAGENCFECKLSFFIFFRCSDNCLVDKKMVQSSTADALKKVLQGVSAHIQANDADELEYNEIAREVTRKK